MENNMAIDRYIENKVDHGFVAPEITPDNYVLGASPRFGAIVCPERDWLPWKPEYEVQRKKIETFNCTGFGTLNMIETFMFKVFNLVVNYSDRFLGVLAETWPPGNSPHKVMETVRKSGCLDEPLLPFSEDIETLEQYYAPAAFDLIEIA